MLKALSLFCWTCLLVTRTAGASAEITIAGAAVSRSKSGDEGRDGAGHMLDLDQVTSFWTQPGSGGVAWMEFHLDEMYCVEKIERFWKSGRSANSWSCSAGGCSCEGHSQSCRVLSVTVASQEAVPGYLTPVSHCRYGDTVRFQSDAGFGIYDLAISGEKVSRPKLSFMEVPKNVSTVAGGSVTLTCKFNRLPSTFGWRYKTFENGVGEATVKEKLASGKWVQSETGDLIIPKLCKHDTGKYTCFGRDETGNIVSKSNLVVNYFDPIETSPESTEALVGDAVTLSCEIPDSYPSLEATMFRVRELEGGNVREAKRVENTTGYKLHRTNSRLELVIEKVTTEDSGNYSCNLDAEYIANDQLYKKQYTSPIGDLSVRGSRPNVLESPDRVTGDLGSTIVVGVSAVGEPAPTVQWFRSDRGEEFELIDISSGRMETKVEQDFYSLTIRNLSLADHGAEFRVKLSNRMGSVTSPKITLLVNHLICEANVNVSSARVRILSREVTLNDQEPGQLVCSEPVAAYPEVTVRWIEFPSIFSLKQVGSILTSDRLTKEDEFTYICDISNVAGTCSNVINLKIRTVEEEEDSAREEETKSEEGTDSEEEEMDSEEAPESQSEKGTESEKEEREDDKKKKSKRCEGPHKKMGRKCLEQSWKERNCATESGATNIKSVTCGKWSKQCDKHGKNKHCCRAVYCWGKKINAELPVFEKVVVSKDETESGEEEEVIEEATKKDKTGRSCPTSHKKMRRRCLEERWRERACDDEDGATHVGNTSCGNLSKRCDANGKNKSCCRAIYCWGKKLTENFPSI